MLTLGLGGRARVGLAAFGAACVVVALGLCGPAVAGAAEELPLPPVQVTYSGTWSWEVAGDAGGLHNRGLLSGSWSAEGDSGGADGPLALNFTSLDGALYDTYPCGAEPTPKEGELSIDPEGNPVAGGWYLDETSTYPTAGWKYIVPVVPSELPLLEEFTSPCEDGPHRWGASVRELVDRTTMPEAKLDELEADLEPVEVLPGEGQTVTKVFSDMHVEEGESGCSEWCNTVKDSLSFTATINGGKVAPEEKKPEKTPEEKGSEPYTPPPAPPPTTEDLRHQRKEEATRDIPPTLERIEGLEVMIRHDEVAEERAPSGRGIGSLAFLIYLDLTREKPELNQELKRLREEYETVHDPADQDVSALAAPTKIHEPGLRSCGHAHGNAARRCATLRTAETRMLTASGQALGVYAALHTTIDRDTAAVAANDAADATLQDAHFRALHTQLASALAQAQSDGAALAKLLGTLALQWKSTKAQDVKAIASMQKKLASEGVTFTQLKAIGIAPPKPHAVNLLRALANGQV
ncbi:MAG: hypothetical protein ACRDJX_07955 [Solirubrobacteraceae bacterium]